tara:strand:+ start:394 stop:666 length:273 start_codon:yes stop_codon:yes gene_type:complete
MLLRQVHDDLNAGEKLVLVQLSTFYPQIYPSLNTLAKQCSMSVSSVQRHIKSLESKDYILKLSGVASKGENPRGNTSNAYILNPVRCGID